MFLRVCASNMNLNDYDAYTSTCRPLAGDQVQFKVKPVRSRHYQNQNTSERRRRKHVPACHVQLATTSL